MPAIVDEPDVKTPRELRIPGGAVAASLPTTRSSASRVTSFGCSPPTGRREHDAALGRRLVGEVAAVEISSPGSQTRSFGEQEAIETPRDPTGRRLQESSSGVTLGGVFLGATSSHADLS
jgi:hypothetical protein